MPVPYVDERAAEKLFRHKVLGLFRRQGLLSEERIQLLLSWRRSGFSVHNRVHAHPDDSRDFEALVRYMMRSPVSLSRLRFTPGAEQVVYTRKGGHDASEPGEDETVDAEDFSEGGVVGRGSVRPLGHQTPPSSSVSQGSKRPHSLRTPAAQPEMGLAGSTQTRGPGLNVLVSQ